MVRINKVTTKTGDKGNTTLAGGQKVSKSSLRIEAYGGIDELNAYLGLIIELCKEKKELGNLHQTILRIQNELFNLGTQLAVLPEDRRENTPAIEEKNIVQLEEEIKNFNSQLKPLTSFLLPGGDLIVAHFHVARTICRRVERSIVRLAENEKLDGNEITYVNRLSDWLFVVSRFVAKKLNKKEILWQPDN